MEQINIGITREKKEDLRVQIQIVESEIKQLKENGDKYGHLPEKQRVLDYLKNEWQKLDNNLGQTYSDVVRQSTQEINEEIKNQKEMTHNDVSINEEWAIDSHYKQIASIEMELTKTNIKLNKELDPFQQVKLQEKIDRLQKELDNLKKYTKSDIIMFAKSRKAAYLNAKQRYRKLSAMEKLRIKMSGKEITWDKIKDDNNVTEFDLDSMYHSRSR